MNTSKILKSLFAFSLLTIMVGTMIHLSSTPAQAVNPINCSNYERPGCYFSEVIVAGPNTFCCYFEGPQCQFGGGGDFRIGPCWQCPF